MLKWSQIKEHIGDAHGLIVADFSTTGLVERAASEVVLLDAYLPLNAPEAMHQEGVRYVSDNWRN